MSTFLVYLYKKKTLSSFQTYVHVIHPVLGPLSRDEGIRPPHSQADLPRVQTCICGLHYITQPAVLNRPSSSSCAQTPILFSRTARKPPSCFPVLHANPHPVFPCCTQTSILFSRTERKHPSCFPVLNANTHPVFPY